MEVKQIYTLVNNALKETLGDSAILQEDLSNLVDVGSSVFDANATDRYVKSLINQIGKIVFVNRAYRGSAPSVLMDSWEFGSVVEKVRGTLYEVSENETWSLNNAEVYEQDTFYKPTVTAKFYNSKTTFELPISIADIQVRQSFQNATQLQSFISLINNDVEKSLTVAMDNLIMRTINNYIGETMYNLDSAGSYSGKSGVRAINLLYLYNQRYSQSLTADNCCTDPDFIRFAIYTMGLYEKRLSKINKVFNMDAQPRFTPSDLLHCVLHADFVAGASAFLYSDTFHNDFVALSKHETVVSWQGIGNGADAWKFSKTAEVKVKTADNHTVDVTGVLGVMFDRDALGVTQLDQRVTSHYNAKAEFNNLFYKRDAGFFNDFSEQFIVFYAA